MRILVTGIVVLFLGSVIGEEAHGVSRTLLFESTADASTLKTVAVLSDGIPLTSLPWSSVTIAADGTTHLLDTAVIYGSETTLVLFDDAGNVSEPSNIITYGDACEDWDLDGSGAVDLMDFGIYRGLILEGDPEVSLLEFGSFRISFGCVVH